MRKHQVAGDFMGLVQMTRKRQVRSAEVSRACGDVPAVAWWFDQLLKQS